MCKNLIFTNIAKIDDINKLDKLCQELLSDQKDGYGFSALGESGLFGKRICYNDHLSEIQTIGNMSDPIGPALFHGRISTNSKSILNTHPIIRDGWHLIHNGVVTNHGKDYKQFTTNDSEHVLYHLISKGIDGVAKNLTGYYAVGAIDYKGHLHVFRDDSANLYQAYSHEIDSFIFATTESIIHKIGDAFDETLLISEFPINTYLKFDHNKIIQKSTFKPLGWDNYSTSLSSQSLGKDYSKYNDDKFWAYGDVSTLYLDEIEYLDESYTIRDWAGKLITIKDFEDLSFDDQLECEITRFDGTTLEPFFDSLASMETLNRKYNA